LFGTKSFVVVGGGGAAAAAACMLLTATDISLKFMYSLLVTEFLIF
jgi:shikimate 5-dehydrogenase